MCYVHLLNKQYDDRYNVQAKHREAKLKVKREFLSSDGIRLFLDAIRDELLPSPPPKKGETLIRIYGVSDGAKNYRERTQFGFA
jgi:hypothetical protein